MAAISVRDIDDDVKQRLRLRAARHGRSMEAEIRTILTDVVGEDDEPRGLFSTILDRFGSLGGVDLDLPDRNTPTRPADFSS